MSSQPGQARSSNIDLITLVIAAIASGVAAYVTSKLWSGGTLISAAMTPVIVALVKEGISRPVDVTTRKMRDLNTGRTVEVEIPRDDVAEFDPLAPVTPPPDTELQTGVSIHRETRARRPWKIALITGLLAFVIAAVVITVPQVISNAGGNGGGTTYFGGGSSSKKEDRDATPTPTASPTATETAEPDATPTATPTEDPTEEEATPTPSATASPTPSATTSPTVTASPTP